VARCRLCQEDELDSPKTGSDRKQSINNMSQGQHIIRQTVCKRTAVSKLSFRQVVVWRKWGVVAYGVSVRRLTGGKQRTIG